MRKRWITCILCSFLVLGCCGCGSDKPLSEAEKEAIYQEVAEEKAAQAKDRAAFSEALADLDRPAESTSSPLPQPDKGPTVSIEGTEEYTKLLAYVDSEFAAYKHRCVYDAETRTFSFYFMLREGLRSDIRQNRNLQDTISDVAETARPLSISLQEYVYDAVNKVSEVPCDAHCTMVMVDTLRADDNYSRDSDVIFQVTDGELIYSMADAVRAERGEQAQPAPATATPQPTKKPAATTKPTPTPTPRPKSESVTTGQRNALKRAKAYLDYTAFSYSGLIEQLEFEGYTHSEAVYGADNCGADWNKQAVRKAKQYLDLMPFSRQGLIEQLEFEGFTHSQAVYGAEQNGY